MKHYMMTVKRQIAITSHILLESLTTLIFSFAGIIIANAFLLIGMFGLIPLSDARGLSFDYLRDVYYGIFQIISNSLNID